MTRQQNKKERNTDDDKFRLEEVGARYLSRRLRHGEVDHVIKGAVLGDGDEDRLVVRGGVDRRHAVETWL